MSRSVSVAFRRRARAVSIFWPSRKGTPPHPGANAPSLSRNAGEGRNTAPTVAHLPSPALRERDGAQRHAERGTGFPGARRRGGGVPPVPPQTHTFGPFAHLGRLEEARTALVRLRKIAPYTSVARLQVIAPCLPHSLFARMYRDREPA
jgi:hypothetical protein